MSTISVIIPVYNASATLDECLQSVVGQSFRDLEIICVDDGSTDDSAEKLAAWQAKDSRIKVLHQENLGGGAARNAGLAVAAGEYIHFLDSDDSLQPKAYEIMHKKICQTGADVCFCQYYTIDAASGKKTKSNSFYRYPEITREGSVRVEGNENVFFYSDVVPWNKLYRRAFVQEHKLTFDTVKSAEDRLFYFRLLASDPLVCFADRPLINYVVNHNSGSLSNLSDGTAWNNHLRGLSAILDLFAESGRRRMAADICFADLYALYLKDVSSLTPGVKKQLSDFLRQLEITAADLSSHLHRSFYRLIVSEKPSIPVVFATNENYLPYLAVTLSSMLANAGGKYFYDIYVFYDRLSVAGQELLAQTAEKYPEAAVTFLNVNRYIDNRKLYSLAHYSKEMYYRLLIPELLRQYSKAVYLDCDLLVEGDIDGFYGLDIGDNLLAGVQNYLDYSMKKYVVDVLKLEEKEYINSGVLLFNLKACRAFGLKEKCLAELARFDDKGCRLACPDQDLLNVCCRGRVLFADMGWNVMWQHRLPQFVGKVNFLPGEWAEYDTAAAKPQIIHYSTGIKPWNYQMHEWADKWWQYAATTPFYHQILCGQVDGKAEQIRTNIADVLRLPRLKRRYWLLWFASKLAFGKKKRRLMKQKRKDLKQRIRAAKKFVKK